MSAECVPCAARRLTHRRMNREEHEPARIASRLWCRVVVPSVAMLTSFAARFAIRITPWLVSLLGVFSTTTEALADERLDRLVKQLASSDFRLRTQAALGLGALREPAAVAPLCGAIGDANQTVKLAAIAGLGKLGRNEGRGCLRQARPKESDTAVVGAIDQALEKIALGGDPPSPASGAKLYVALQVTNKTGRPELEVEGLVRRSLQDKLLASPLLAVAPRGETSQQAKQVLASKRLTGYLLVAAAEPFLYKNGDLTVQLRVTMWSYPDKALTAEFAPKVTQQGTSAGDKESENMLLQMASDSAAQSFLKVAPSL